MALKKVKNKNQETGGYGRDKRPKTEKLKRKEITITEKLEKTETEKKAVKQSAYPGICASYENLPAVQKVYFQCFKA